MKSDIIRTLTANFEGHAQQTEGGVEFWLARDLQFLLGYSKWDNFLNVVSKAKTACEVSGHEVAHHFADVGKMVDLGSGSRREIDDISRPLEQKATGFSERIIGRMIAFYRTYIDLIDLSPPAVARLSTRAKVSQSAAQLGEHEKMQLSAAQRSRSLSWSRSTTEAA